MRNDAMKQYKSVNLQAAVSAASPHQLISMLYAGAHEAIARAKGSVERNDIEGRTAQINKASDIIVNLKSMLDHSKSAEVSQSLDQLYDVLIAKLFEANRTNSGQMLEEVNTLLAEVSTAWAEIDPE
ncbi:MAG: flagellar export chaperone FliS [Oceanospirillaceae bacterium]|nr:flagellar export chaperone FliS [Oceanospirillaceae bacterium]